MNICANPVGRVLQFVYICRLHWTIAKEIFRSVKDNPSTRFRICPFVKRLLPRTDLRTAMTAGSQHDLDAPSWSQKALMCRGKEKKERTCSGVLKSRNRAAGVLSSRCRGTHTQCKLSRESMIRIKWPYYLVLQSIVIYYLSPPRG